MSTEARDLPVGELLARFTEQTSRLVRQELELARVEMSARLKQFTGAASFLGVAVVLGIAAIATATVTIIAALATIMPVWAAALIVTVVYGIIAAVFVAAGRARLATIQLTPTETIETVKEDAQWIATRAKSARK